MFSNIVPFHEPKITQYNISFLQMKIYSLLRYSKILQLVFKGKVIMASLTAKNAVNKQQNIPSEAAAQQAKILQECNLRKSHYA